MTFSEIYAINELTPHRRLNMETRWMYHTSASFGELREASKKTYLIPKGKARSVERASCYNQSDHRKEQALPAP